ncbi:HAD family hydrolase [Gemmiger sp.]
MMQFHALIASDLDGTLLPEGQTELSPDVFDEIRRLHDRGVLFCAASGRPLDTLWELFAPVADDIAYMSENAAYVAYGHTLLNTIAMPRDLCAELVTYLGTRTDCVSRACTTTGRYYFVPTDASRAQLDAVGVEFGGCRIVKDFSAVKGDVTQISAISAGDMNLPAKEILPLWQDRIGAAVTGEHWLDFTAAGKDKGLRLLCEHFNIPQANTYAFGDSYNDAPMLRAAAHPYLMDIAPADLKAEFGNQIEDVLPVLKTLP